MAHAPAASSLAPVPPSRRRTRPAGVFATMAVAAAVLAGAVVLGVRTMQSATSVLPALNDTTPPLASVPPVLGPAPRRLARRVVFVLVDGLRLDNSYGRPFLDRLRARGIDAQAKSHFPSLSRPNHTAVVTGVPPRWSGVRTNHHRGRPPLDTLMKRARAAGLQVALHANGSDSFGEMFGPDLDEAVNVPWPGGLMARTAARALDRGDELVLLWFLDVDTAGHLHGGATPPYREAMRGVDHVLETLLARVDLEHDAIIVTSDHGHLDRGGHGGVEPEVLGVPLVLAGAGIRRGAVLRDARLIDVAPTVATLLGLPAPGHALGRVLTDALAIDPVEAEALARVDAARHARLRPVIDEAAARMRAARRNAILERGGLVLGALVALGVATWLLACRGVVRVDRRIVLVALPVFPLLFYGAVSLLQPWLSPSGMTELDEDIARKLFAYGGLAAACHLVATWTALRGRATPHERLAATAGNACLGLLVTIAPAGAAWALAGPTAALELPGPRALMLPLVTYTAVSCYAFAAAVGLAIEHVVFVARVSDRLAARGLV